MCWCAFSFSAFQHEISDFPKFCWPAIKSRNQLLLPGRFVTVNSPKQFCSFHEFPQFCESNCTQLCRLTPSFFHHLLTFASYAWRLTSWNASHLLSPSCRSHGWIWAQNRSSLSRVSSSSKGICSETWVLRPGKVRPDCVPACVCVPVK